MKEEGQSRFSRRRSGRGAARSGSRGFTLIELLTVIAIIGILAAILIPVGGAAREQGRRAVCGSNIRQQLVAMHLFADENNDIGYWPVQSASDDSAPFYLYPEWVDDMNLFICPSTKNQVGRRFNKSGEQNLDDLKDNAQGGREDSSGGHSYEYFGLYGTGFAPDEEDRVMKTPLTTAGFETITVLLFDGADDQTSQNCPTAKTGNHYDAGFNFGFADGHVEWVSRDRINEVFVASFHGKWCD